MKRILFVGFLMFMLSGCTSSGEEVSCIVEGKEAVFILKDGMVTSYVLDGKSISGSEIDEINGTYFTSATNNEEGKTALNNYVQSIGGSCN